MFSKLMINETPGRMVAVKTALILSHSTLVRVSSPGRAHHIIDFINHSQSSFSKHWNLVWTDTTLDTNLIP